MARYNTNRYQYETSPRKLQPEYEPKKRKTQKKQVAKKSKSKVNTKKKSNSKIILYIAIAFVILFAVSFRNALISQKYTEIKKLKGELSNIEKENKQLEVNIESKVNLGTIEKKATEELGLKKLDDSQTVYVSLNKQDYIESSTEEIMPSENENWFESLVNKIKNIF